MLAGFDKRSFSSDAMGDGPRSFDIYEKGAGPVVVLLQELPGISTHTVVFADKMVAAGFRIVMPHLFGPLGRFALGRNLAKLFCVRREINIFLKNDSSPIVDWLRDLCADAKERYDVAGIGVVGMCLSGNFAISLTAEESVTATAVGQPSLPMFSQKSLHMSPAAIDASRQRLDETGPVLAYRFENDRLCTAAKFEALDKAFNDDRTRMRLTTVPGNKHALFTDHFIDEDGSPTQAALDEVIAHFHDRLQA